MWTQIDAQISQAIDQSFESRDRRSVGGGCINQGYRISDGTLTFFVKLNRADQLAMFEAEAIGLRHMREAEAIRIPKPICTGISESSAYIVLEWLDLGRGSSQAWADMGRNLARMHQYQKSTAFGWERNNTIGSTPQINSWTSNWTEFFTQYRIGYQLELGARNGGQFRNGAKLLEQIPELLADHKPKPSIVHGDLWSGNAAVMQSGEPVIFDPATYWGDREVDLAMTELFGGFPAEFYRGYEESYPTDAGYKRRKTLYNLYHILNHFNLFGGSYESQANRIIDQLIM
ncbi:fructosamine kinase family protein [Leptolyngbya sp. AN03gr2]|uniref:fructosamine kinase family protein n=1 Tax=unclassified Leptolyngbya TaxID=2650499 RepID=UPI003D313EF0